MSSPSSGGPPARLPVEGDLVAGKYRIERVLGRGGMGVVFAAHHELLGQSVALKLLLPEIAQTQGSVARFLNEARSAGRLENAHVARVMDVGMLDGGLPFLVMEMLTGSDLDEILARGGPMPLPAVVDYLLQAIEAIAEAHTAGIVHRDLKPSNLFLARRKDGPIIKVLDFGISKVLTDVPGRSGITTTSAVLGSPGYMSPEQLRDARGIDARADIWSLGVIAYELLTATLPFDGPNVVAIFAAIQETNPPALSLRCQGVPPPVEAAVHRCLERSLDRRFASVTDFAVELAPYGTTAAQHSLAQIRRILPESPRAAPLGRTVLATTVDPTSPGIGPSDLGVRRTEPIRTTAGMAMHPAGVPKKGRGLAVVALCGLVGVGGGLVLAFHRSDGDASTAGTARAPGADKPLASTAPSTAPSADAVMNRWVRVNPPASPLSLGVPDGTPAVVRGIRAARHFVTPPAPFEIQQHEVTWGELSPWLARNPAYRPVSEPPGLPGGPARRLYPVTGVSWEGALDYCKSIGGGLPREDEWEYAARGAHLRKYSWGDDPLDLQRTNAFGGPGSRLKPVMTDDQDQTPDAEPIYDLMGNAREWTTDPYREDEAPKSPTEEEWTHSGGMYWRAIRGLPVDEKAKRPLDTYGAPFRSQLCASGPCPVGTDKIRLYVGFRCVKQALSP